jgi:hypothetical protein
MTTQTRRTTQRAVKFHRTTLKAFIVTACYGLVLWGAVAAHALSGANGMPFNGMPFNGAVLQGMPFQGLPMNGWFFNGLPAQDSALPAGQPDRLPWSTLSQRPLGTRTP